MTTDLARRQSEQELGRRRFIAIADAVFDADIGGGWATTTPSKMVSGRVMKLVLIALARFEGEPMGKHRLGNLTGLDPSVAKVVTKELADRSLVEVHGGGSLGKGKGTRAHRYFVRIGALHRLARQPERAAS